MSVDLVKLLQDTLTTLDSIVTELEESNVNVSFFHERGDFGRHVKNKSDRIKLASVTEYRVHYDFKDTTTNLLEGVNEQTTKA